MLVTTCFLDHHGIVSGIYDELEIGKVIDEEDYKSKNGNELKISNSSCQHG